MRVTTVLLLLVSTVLASYIVPIKLDASSSHVTLDQVASSGANSAYQTNKLYGDVMGGGEATFHVGSHASANNGEQVTNAGMTGSISGDDSSVTATQAGEAKGELTRTNGHIVMEGTGDSEGNIHATNMAANSAGNVGQTLYYDYDQKDGHNYGQLSSSQINTQRQGQLTESDQTFVQRNGGGTGTVTAALHGSANDLKYPSKSAYGDIVYTANTKSDGTYADVAVDQDNSINKNQAQSTTHVGAGFGGFGVNGDMTLSAGGGASQDYTRSAASNIDFHGEAKERDYINGGGVRTDATVDSQANNRGTSTLVQSNSQVGELNGEVNVGLSGSAQNYRQYGPYVVTDKSAAHATQGLSSDNYGDYANAHLLGHTSTTGGDASTYVNGNTYTTAGNGYGHTGADAHQGISIGSSEDTYYLMPVHNPYP